MATSYMGTGANVYPTAANYTSLSWRTLLPTNNFTVCSENAYTIDTARVNVEDTINRYIYTPLTQENLYRLRTEVNEALQGTAYDNQTSAITVGYGTAGTIELGLGGQYFYQGTQNVAQYTYDPINESWVTNNYIAYPVSDKKWEQQQKLRKNLYPVIKSRTDVQRGVVPESESVARSTLREVVTEADFRKYLKYGFVLVKAESGATYQVFRNRSHVKVWLEGHVIEEICIRIANLAVPPTDTIVAFKTMIEADEQEFRKMGNVYNMCKAA